jgi:guanine nucleotide-binding protein subunit alpha
VLFLNKCDLLREKLQAGVRLKNYLVTYGDRPNDYESVSKCAPSQLPKMGDSIANIILDLRNKFGSMHNQISPRRERELFSAYVVESLRDWLTVVLVTVHYTAVIDKAKTSQLITNGAC